MKNYQTRYENKNWESREWKERAEGTLFDLGTIILGERSFFAKLYHKVGFDRARQILKAARFKSEPLEYVAAAMKEHNQQTASTMSQEEIDRRIAEYKEKWAKA